MWVSIHVTRDDGFSTVCCYPLFLGQRSPPPTHQKQMEQSTVPTADFCIKEPGKHISFLKVSLIEVVLLHSWALYRPYYPWKFQHIKTHAMGRSRDKFSGDS